MFAGPFPSPLLLQREKHSALGNEGTTVKATTKHIIYFQTWRVGNCLNFISFGYAAQEKCDLISEYIRRLKVCIKWFQQLEHNHVTQQEIDKSLVEAAEKKCYEMEMLMNSKEEELNSIIMELRKTNEGLQDKCTKEESAKLEAMDSLTREKEDRDTLEKLQASAFEELTRSLQDNVSANQKVNDQWSTW